MTNGLPINQILQGDCRLRLAELPERSVQMVVTSPPYWGLRDYGIKPSVWGGDPACEHDWVATVAPGGDGSGKTFRRDREAGRKRGCLQPGFCTKCGAWLGVYGLEPMPELYVEHTVEIFRSICRVLRDDGTIWVNLGDSYWSKPNGSVGATTIDGSKAHAAEYRRTNGLRKNRQATGGIKYKDIVGIPWRVALALQADGWYLRQDIIWHKPNPMPESVTDRCTKAHEYIFLLTKSAKYYYDIEAIKEVASDDTHARYARGRSDHHKNADGGPGNQTICKTLAHMLPPGVNPKCLKSSRGTKQNPSFAASVKDVVAMRNKRSVWTVPTAPFKEAHFATFPPELIRPCILAGCPKGGIVLDPFGGSGTTGYVAAQEGRDYILIELNPKYVAMAETTRLAEVETGVPVKEAKAGQLSLFTGHGSQVTDHSASPCPPCLRGESEIEPL